MNSLETLARAALAKHYGRSGSLTRLAGEVDINFHVHSVDGSHAVLKIYAPMTSSERAIFETSILATLATRAPKLPVQRVLPGNSGEMVYEIAAEDGGYTRNVRLTSWLEGTVWASTVWASTGTDSSAQLQAAATLGGTLARLDRVLAQIDQPEARRYHRWDLAHAADHLQVTSLIADVETRQIVHEILTDFAERVLPRLDGQAQQLIHNDANDHNVLIGDNGLVSGLLDFGDAVWSFRINEVAIASAYAMLGSHDPIGVAVALAGAYHDESALTEVEADLLYDLILTRYATSICLAAKQICDDPTNQYLLISQSDITNMVHILRRQNRSLAVMRLRAACRFDAVVTSPAVQRWLERNGARCVPVLRRDMSRHRLTVLDLSVNGPTGDSLDPLFDDDALEHTLPVGRYGEDRSVYQTNEFAVSGSPERRTIHVGIDLFAPAGDEVLAPLDGVVADFGNETVPLGFGGILVLRHETDDGTPFWTVFGHLAPSSLEPLVVGRAVRAGEVIGRLGTPPENGGWPPHLHFQVMTDLCGWSAVEIIGVVTRSQWDVWRSLFLNPNLVLGLPVSCSAMVTRPAQWLRRERHHVLGRSLSLSYTQPLKFVAGEGVHLIDEDGQRYLDMVNNVCHVGHCHPRVVAAGQRQMARLNTNSRYLHDNLVEYARRLTATFPPELSVVFMVNSGSEANDLALRLARTFTGQRQVISLDHAYHGNLTSIVEVSPYKFAGPGGDGQASHIWVAEMPDLYRGRWHYGDPQAGVNYAQSVAGHVEAMSRIGVQPAALFSEGILGTGGILTLPDGYLAAAYEHVRRAGGLCVADEVQVGFGRVGTQMWAFATHNVVPDIVTLGKPIGNGHPMAAVVTRPEIAAAFANGMEYFSTFGGNPVSAAIGLEVLDVIRDERLMHNADEVGTAMKDGLRSLAERHPLIGDIRGHGLFIGVELVLNRTTREPAPAALNDVIEAMKAQRVLLSGEGPHHNVLKIKPPITFSHENNAEFLSKLEHTLTVVERKLHL